MYKLLVFVEKGRPYHVEAFDDSAAWAAFTLGWEMCAEHHGIVMPYEVFAFPTLEDEHPRMDWKRWEVVRRRVHIAALTWVANHPDVAVFGLAPGLDVQVRIDELESEIDRLESQR